MMTRYRFVFAALILLAAPLGAAAADFPACTIKLYLPFGPGSVSHSVTTRFAEVLGEKMKRTVIVLPRPSADGIAAALAVKQDQPDGCSLFMGGEFNAVATAEAEMKGRELPYKLDDFSPVSGYMSVAMVIVARKETPYKKLGDLLAFAESNPGKLDIAVGTRSSSNDLAIRLIKARSKLDFVTIPHKSVADILAAVQSGNINVAVQPYGAFRGIIDAGVVRPIAVTSTKRAAYLPNVPTVAEIPGLEDVKLDAWGAWFIHKDTPRDRVNYLTSRIKEALRDPRVVAAFEKAALQIEVWSAEELGSVMSAELARWRKEFRASP